MHSRKNSKKAVLLTVQCLLCCLAAAILAVFCFRVDRERKELMEQAEAVREENQSLQNQIDALNIRIQSMTEAEEELRSQLRSEKELRSRLEREKKAASKQPPAPPEQITSVADYAVGDILDPDVMSKDLSGFFQSSEILENDAVYSRINGKSYRENDKIDLKSLRYLKMIHYNFDHQVQVGEMIVNEAIAEDVMNVFRELYSIEYEVEKMYLIDTYWVGDGSATDEVSMHHNNTSCFCYRAVTGGDYVSNHGYGRAIDINPLQNPYVTYDDSGKPHCSPQNAGAYIDRGSKDPHVIVKGDDCYNIFIKYGFDWGGSWENPADYQHFEKE